MSHDRFHVGHKIVFALFLRIAPSENLEWVDLYSWCLVGRWIINEKLPFWTWNKNRKNGGLRKKWKLLVVIKTLFICFSHAINRWIFYCKIIQKLKKLNDKIFSWLEIRMHDLLSKTLLFVLEPDNGYTFTFWSYLLKFRFFWRHKYF